MYMLLQFPVVEEGLPEPFHARDWLETCGQGPCGTLTIALSPCGNLFLIREQPLETVSCVFDDNLKRRIIF